MVHVAIGDDVRKVTIEGIGKDQQVVMRHELSEDNLELATGGQFDLNDCRHNR